MHKHIYLFIYLFIYVFIYLLLIFPLCFILTLFIHLLYLKLCGKFSDIALAHFVLLWVWCSM